MPLALRTFCVSIIASSGERLLPVDNLIEVMNSCKKAIRCIRANNQPILMPTALTLPALHELSITDDEIQRRARVITQAHEFQARVGEAITNRYPPREPSLYVEEQIYDGFPTRTDEFLMEQFHRAAWEKRIQIVERFEDERLRELGYRLIFLERPGTLSAEKKLEMERWRCQRISSIVDVPWLTLDDALAEARELFEQDPETGEMLSELMEWLHADTVYRTKRSSFNG